jgi:ATP/maltotriose-dependent transcriptional regulator MalT
MISNECFISTSTVASHIQNIYGKLGVKNATAAVAKAVVSKIV